MAAGKQFISARVKSIQHAKRHGRDQRARLAALKKQRKAIQLTTHTSVSLHLISSLFIPFLRRAHWADSDKEREKPAFVAIAKLWFAKVEIRDGQQLLGVLFRRRAISRLHRKELSSEKVYHSRGGGRQRGHKYSCVHCLIVFICKRSVTPCTVTSGNETQIYSDRTIIGVKLVDFHQKPCLNLWFSQ